MILAQDESSDVIFCHLPYSPAQINSDYPDIHFYQTIIMVTIQKQDLETKNCVYIIHAIILMKYEKFLNKEL